VEVRGSQSADPAAHHDQVVVFRDLLRRCGIVPERSIAEAVGDLERTRMAPAQARCNRRIVTGPILGLVAGPTCSLLPAPQQRRPHTNAAHLSPPPTSRKSRRGMVRSIPSSRSGRNRGFSPVIEVNLQKFAKARRYALCSSSTARHAWSIAESV